MAVFTLAGCSHEESKTVVTDHVQKNPAVIQLTEQADPDERVRRPSLLAKATAEADIQRGHMAFKYAGLPNPWEEAYRQHFQSKHQVSADQVAGCLVSPETAAAIQAYNNVSIPEIERRIGKKFTEIQPEADREAQEIWQKKPRTQ